MLLKEFILLLGVYIQIQFKKKEGSLTPTEEVLSWIPNIIKQALA